MESISLRTCQQCGMESPETNEHFRMLNGKMRFVCRRCEAAAAREYAAKNRQGISERVKQWRLENPEAAKARDKRLNDRRERKPKTPARLKQMRDQARAKYWADPEKARARQNAYCAANRLARRGYLHTRRAKIKQVGGIHTAKHIEAAYAGQKGKCYWCSKKLNRKFHVDHIFPISKGGTNGPENICCACPSCNWSKNARMPWDFAGRLL